MNCGSNVGDRMKPREDECCGEINVEQASSRLARLSGHSRIMEACWKRMDANAFGGVGCRKRQI